ncbi:MAG: hypothetical protein AB1442_10705 [Nitrospirota bacterium]
MDNTLLESFIEQKAKAYAEPSQRGMSKGQRLGFSKKKYLATLYMLTADKQITMAMELGISYGLLRKWKTEKPFRATVRKHCKEFADTFIKYVSERYEQQENVRNEDLNSSGAAVRDENPFRDSGNYSPELLAGILKSVVDVAERAEKEDAFPDAFALLCSFLKLVAPAIAEKALKEMSRNAGIDLTILARGLKLGVIERVKEILVKADIADDERKEACYLLTELGTII